MNVSSGGIITDSIAQFLRTGRICGVGLGSDIQAFRDLLGTPTYDCHEGKGEHVAIFGGIHVSYHSNQRVHIFVIEARWTRSPHFDSNPVEQDLDRLGYVSFCDLARALHAAEIDFEVDESMTFGDQLTIATCHAPNVRWHFDIQPSRLGKIVVSDFRDQFAFHCA